jgi:hypothetical protein
MIGRFSKLSWSGTQKRSWECFKIKCTAQKRIEVQLILHILFAFYLHGKNNELMNAYSTYIAHTHAYSTYIPKIGYTLCKFALSDRYDWPL